MSIRRCLILVWMLAALPVVSMGQDQPSQNSTTQTSSDDGTVKTPPAAALSSIAGLQPEGVTEEDTDSGLPQIPALLGGQGASTAFLSELQRSNYLRGGVNVGATYDDNPLLLSTGQQSNTSETIFPNIKIDESTSRTRWTLGYAGGLTVNQKITTENQGSHNVFFDSQFRLSPHLNLRVAESFFLTTGLFDAGNGIEGVPGSGGPNASLITPLSTQRSTVTTVETNYHFALNDLIGASGSYNDLHFSNPAVGAQLPLTDTQTASGSAFWLHRIFGSDWAGVSYRFDRITFNGGSGESQVHSFMAVDTLNISKRFTLTGFGGSQYSENQGVSPSGLPPATNGWSAAGGAEGGWQAQRTSVSVGYSRRISDGGGVLGAVRLQNSYGTFRRELVPGWAVALTASHGTNQAISVVSAGGASSIDLTSAGISLERNVGKSVGLRLGYTHDFQEQIYAPTAPTPSFDASRNRFFATLSYQWAKPLGK
ncbi:MAG: hypothetical protein ACLPLR_07435 [Terriglobales bacterium]